MVLNSPPRPHSITPLPHFCHVQHLLGDWYLSTWIQMVTALNLTRFQDRHHLTSQCLITTETWTNVKASNSPWPLDLHSYPFLTLFLDQTLQSSSSWSCWSSTLPLECKPGSLGVSASASEGVVGPSWRCRLHCRQLDNNTTWRCHFWHGIKQNGTRGRCV